MIGALLLPLKAIAETIPIPPKRPAVMNVSPSYLEELRKRHQQTQPVTKSTPAETERKPSAPVNQRPKGKLSDEGEENEIVDINSAELLEILDQNRKRSSTVTEKNSFAPIPKRKPRYNDIEPAAHSDSDEETTLVSFALEPEQIYLDQNLKDFLSKHAVRLLSEHRNLKMEIQAYSTPIQNEEHSDVRLSLARALEVRSFLINKGVSATRLKLSPMGNDKANDSDDRIDLLFIEK